MKILILTQYYPPENGAPQNRLSSLAYHLTQAGHTVEVVTAFPNYPEYVFHPDYRDKKRKVEVMDGIRVIRTNLFISKRSGPLYRLLTYLSFAFNSYFSALRNADTPQVLICESPPLFLGITALALKRKWKTKMVFNVSDLWPESVEQLGIIKNKHLLALSYRLANHIYDNSDLICGQTNGIVLNINEIVPEKRTIWIPNGIDRKKFESFSLVSPKKDKTEFCLLYAGILGYAQGLEVIIETAIRLKDFSEIKFVLAGDGPERTRLIGLKDQLKLENVFFTGNLSPEALYHQLVNSDACIVPLKKLQLFKGAIPSKVFEAMYIGKPILLGVEGEAKTLFIYRGNAGLFFEPENPDDLAEKIKTLYYNRALALQLGKNGKRLVEENFDRKRIAETFEIELQALLPDPTPAPLTQNVFTSEIMYNAKE